MDELVKIITDLGQWNWLILGFLLFSLEFLLPGFHLLFFGVAALLTAVIGFTFDIAWQYQVAIFAVLCVISAFTARLIWNPNVASDEPLLNKRGQQFIGKNYTLVTDLENGRGKVKVGDSLWLVTGPDLPSGTKVKVVDVADSMLVVDQA